MPFKATVNWLFNCLWCCLVIGCFDWKIYVFQQTVVSVYYILNPELQLKDTESAIKSKLIDLFTQLKGFKFVATLVLVFKKIESEDKTMYDPFYSNSKAELIISESDINDLFQSI